MAGEPLIKNTKNGMRDFNAQVAIVAPILCGSFLGLFSSISLHHFILLEPQAVLLTNRR